MAVYVDALRPCIPNNHWKWNHSCHLIADSDEELHKFAAQLWLKREWFQSKNLRHYDLTASKRYVAVNVLGAKEISDADFIAFFHKQLGRGGHSDEE